jgi:SNF2 family DNA or RNA helicase
LPELPVKSYQDVPVEVDDNLRKILDQMRNIIEARGMTVEDYLVGNFDITSISRLRAAVASAKADALLAEVLAHERDNEPLVVFSAHVEPLRGLSARKGWALIDGSTSTAARERAMADFQAGKLIGLACSIKAAGVGVDLTRANRVLFVDREWVPALNEQAEDRLLGINQKRGVLVSTLVCDHPIEQRLYEVLLTKQSTIAGLF